jgi:hypothetical protein
MVGHQLLGKKADVWPTLMYPVKVMRYGSAKIGGKKPRLFMIYR